MGRQSLGLKAGAASCTLFCRALLCLLSLLNFVFYPFSASLPPLFLSLCILSLGSLSFLLCLFCFYLSASSSFHLSLSAFLSQISLSSFLFFSSCSFLLSVPLSLSLLGLSHLSLSLFVSSLPLRHSHTSPSVYQSVVFILSFCKYGLSPHTHI